MANDLKYLISSTGDTIDFSAVVRGNIFADTDFTDNRVLIYNNKKVKASGFTAQSASNTGFGFIKGDTAETAWTLNIKNGVAKVRVSKAGANLGLAITNDVDWGVVFDGNTGKGSVNTVKAGDKLGLTKNASTDTYWGVRYDNNGIGSVKTRLADETNQGLVILSSSKSDTATGHVATAAQLKAAWDAIDSKAGTGLANGTSAGLMVSSTTSLPNTNPWLVFCDGGIGKVKTVTGNNNTEGLVKLSDVTNGTESTTGGVAATPKAVAAAYTAATTKANRVAGTTPSTTSGIVTPSTENWKVDFSNGVGTVNKKWANDAGSDGGLVQNNDVDWGVKFAAKSAQDSNNGKGNVKTVLAASTVSGLASHNETNTPTGWGVKYGDTRDGLGFVTPQLAGTKNSAGESFRGTVLPNSTDNDVADNGGRDYGVRYDSSSPGYGYTRVPYAGSDPGVIKINPNTVSTYWRVQLDENKYAGVVPVSLSSTSSGIVNVYVGEEEREKYYLNSNGEWKKIENPKIALMFDDTTFKVYAQIYSGNTPPAGYVDGSTGVKVGADSVEKAKYAQYLVSNINSTSSSVLNTKITQSTTNDGTLRAHILELT